MAKSTPATAVTLTKAAAPASAPTPAPKVEPAKPAPAKTKPKAEKKPTIGSVIRYNLVRDEKMTVEQLGEACRKAGLGQVKEVTLKIGYQDTMSVIDALKEAGRLKPLTTR
jgi:hypothetical protein